MMKASDRKSCKIVELPRSTEPPWHQRWPWIRSAGVDSGRIL